MTRQKLPFREPERLTRFQVVIRVMFCIVCALQHC